MRSDRELVAASLDGETSAFALLIDRHRGRVSALALAMLGNREEAEDVTQEAMLRAFLALAELKEPTRFGSWVCGIAVNLAKMRLRRSRDVPVSPEALAGGSVLPGSVSPAAPDPLPEQAVEERESLERLRDALALLPAHEREVVLLHYLEGLTAQEIAALLGEATGTVRVRLHRARRRLRVRLSDRRKEMRPMIEVTLHDVVVRVLSEDATTELPRLANERLRVVLLKEKDGDRVLPIWVGSAEGDALALHLGGEPAARPLTADLMARLVEVTDTRIERVAVSSLRDKTFYAIVTVTRNGDSSELDARPSDALNLAARVGAPIYVEPDVMQEAIPADDLEGGMSDLESEWLESGGDPEPASEWRSLSPELVKSLYTPLGRK